MQGLLDRVVLLLSGLFVARGFLIFLDCFVFHLRIGFPILAMTYMLNWWVFETKRFASVERRLFVVALLVYTFRQNWLREGFI